MQEIPFARIRSWMFDEALPYWAQVGEDRAHGGTVEERALDGGPSDPGFKRVRVPCRQVYVWSHAALLGWQPGLQLARAHGQNLIKTAWQGPQKGWARRLNSDNSVLDGRADLYDTAFAMFALGWWYRASGDQIALDTALATLDFVNANMRHPQGKGFLHALPAEGPRIQNPHMHLLEASLACFEASKDERFGDLAREIVGLFQTHFYDPASSTLGEYFNEDWSRLAGEQGRIVEPGHQLEWAWILAQANRLLGLDVTATAQGLVAFAERFGIDPVSFATYNSVRDDGTILDGGSRTWPNTERVKGAVAMFELTGANTRAMIAQSAGLLLDRYLSNCPRGGWIDAFDAKGQPIARAMPVSTLYHVFLAFAEILRLEGALSRPG